MIRLIRRLLRRRDPHSLAILEYRGAPKGQRRDALKTLRRVATEELRRAVA